MKTTKSQRQRNDFVRNQKYRLLILGAGFSKPAGLPLAKELWTEILRLSKSLTGRASKLRDDINAYIAYRRACDGIDLTPEIVDFEEFLSFLDIEHYLGLRGSDHWSSEGNEGQIVVKTLIGKILSKRTPIQDKIPELYLEFARRLQPGDCILTFNYDVLLERALDTVGRRYRLFPNRLKSVHRFGGEVDTDRESEEVAVIKLHGSIDWFDKSRYLERLAIHENDGGKSLPFDPVFNSAEDWGVKSLLEGAVRNDDPLRNMCRISRIAELYRQDLMFHETPWVLTPSISKILYAKPVEDFWRGLGRSGAMNFGMAVIGYSLPAHDLYVRQVLYSLAVNYQGAYWGKKMSGLRKSPLALVDHRATKRGCNELRHNYRFLDFSRTKLHCDGFNMDALDKIFA